jgi:outer membrane protein TolC
VRGGWQRALASGSRESGSAQARSHVRLLILSGLLFVSQALTGCAVGPDFKPQAPPNTNSYLSNPAEDRVPGHPIVHNAEIPPQWWELFRSPALNRIVEDGIVHNSDLAAAEAAVRVAQANALVQRGALFPSVAGNFSSPAQTSSICILAR